MAHSLSDRKPRVFTIEPVDRQQQRQTSRDLSKLLKKDRQRRVQKRALRDRSK